MDDKQLVEAAKAAYPDKNVLLALYLFVHVNLAGKDEQVARKEYVLMKARTKSKSS